MGEAHMRDTLGSFGSIGLSAAQSWSVSLGFQHGLHAACRRPRLGPRLETVCFRDDAEVGREAGAQPMKNFSPLQQISIACAILAILFYFALQIPWVAALFG
jgi:hypothetical protein